MHGTLLCSICPQQLLSRWVARHKQARRRQPAYLSSLIPLSGKLSTLQYPAGKDPQGASQVSSLVHPRSRQCYCTLEVKFCLTIHRTSARNVCPARPSICSPKWLLFHNIFPRVTPTVVCTLDAPCSDTGEEGGEVLGTVIRRKHDL